MVSFMVDILGLIISQVYIVNYSSYSLGMLENETERLLDLSSMTSIDRIFKYHFCEW